MDHIKNVRFSNYKALSTYSLNLQDANIIIGPNNCGKSTIIGAFRLLDLGIKKARSKKADIVQGPNEQYSYGFILDETDASISLENVSTDYNQESSSIIFTLTSGNQLILYFPTNHECIFTWNYIGPRINTPSKFKEAFGLEIKVIPVLGPFEHDESILTQETIRKGISSHRSSRHFRNYWYKNNDGWDSFKSLIEKTWPGMSIKPPEYIDGSLKMFCSENRIDREIFWAGFGFQIWCQLLTHLSQANTECLVIVDEPEIYLHPDVQRQLLGIVKDIGCDFVMATHSVEIITEADPSDLLMINKNALGAIRLKDIKNVQKAIDIIGSTHNITLAQLARTRRMIFSEGQKDSKILKKLSRQLGFNEIASGNDLTWFESGGFASWDSIKEFSKMIERTVDEKLAICTIYDRDYYCDEELQRIKEELESAGVTVIFHSVKEIENYLLVPENIAKAFFNVDERITEKIIIEMLEIITASLKADIQGQYIGKRIEYFKRSKEDISTISAEALRSFEAKWSDINQRIKIIPGKLVLQKLREYIQTNYASTISDSKLIEVINKKNAQAEIFDLINEIEKFRLLKL